MSNDRDQRFFKRLKCSLKGRRLDRSMIETELKAHLEEKRREQGETPIDPAAVLGHPVDLADEYNRVFRWRRHLRRAIIAAPTIAALAIYTMILASDFPLIQMPFGVFTSLSLGEVGWVSSKIGVAEQSLVDCNLPPFMQSDFLGMFGVPRAWHRAYEEKDARCLSAINRHLAADIPQSVRARFDGWRQAHPSSAAFLVKCQFEGPCVRPTHRVQWAGVPIDQRDDHGKFLLLTVETEMFRHNQPRAYATGTLLDQGGMELPAFTASGLYDWDGMIIIYLPLLALGTALSLVIWLLDLAWAAFRKRRRRHDPDLAPA